MSWNSLVRLSVKKSALAGGLFGALLGAAGSLAGCDSQIPTHYTVTFNLEVPGDHRQPQLESLPALPLEQLGMRYSAGVKNKVYTIHDLDYVFLDTFRLVAVSGGDLSWLGRVRFMLESPGLPTLVLAYAEGFGTDQTSMDFETNDDELWEYFKNDYRIYAEVEDSVRPKRTVQLRIDAKFKMRVNIHAVSTPYYPMM